MSFPPSSRGELPPQRRTRAIADPEKRIASAEATRDHWLHAVETLTATGRPCRREQAMVPLAEGKLQLLRGSVGVLAGDHSP